MREQMEIQKVQAEGLSMVAYFLPGGGGVEVVCLLGAPRSSTSMREEITQDRTI